MGDNRQTAVPVDVAELANLGDGRRAGSECARADLAWPARSRRKKGVLPPSLDCPAGIVLFILSFRISFILVLRSCVNL